MGKMLKKVTAVVLAVAMAAAFSPAVVSVSGATTASMKVSIKVTNKDDLVDLDIGDKEKIKYKVTVSGGEKNDRKKAKQLEFSSKDKKIATVDSNGKVKAKGDGKTKIELVSKMKNKVLAKTSVVVEVSPDWDMVFKYSNLYFVVPEGTAFPVEIKQGDKDARGCAFDIKTKGFDAKLSDFRFASDNPKIADVNGEQGKLILSGYGETDIECEYKKDVSTGDSFTCYVLTQAQFDQMKAEDNVDDTEENTFDSGSEDDDEPDVPEDTDTSEDVDNTDE